MYLARLVVAVMATTFIIGCGSPSKPVAKKDASTKKTSKPKTTTKNSQTTTPPKAPRPVLAEDTTSSSIDFTPPGLKPGSEPIVETTPAPKAKAPPKSQAGGPAGKTRKSASGQFEYWMPNGAGASDPFDFRSGDIQSKGVVWFSRDMQTMLGFAEVRLDGSATKEILKQTAEQSSAGEDPNIPWVATTFCGCEALERIEVLDFGEGKSHSREIIFIDGDTIYQIEGLQPGDKPVSVAVSKLFESCQRVAGAKTPAPKGRGDYVRSPISGEYEVWMPREPMRTDPGSLKYKDRLSEDWDGFIVDTNLTFYFSELDVGEPATLEIAHTVVKTYWPSTRGTSKREVKYAGVGAIEQTVISDDELQVRYFVPIGNKVYFIAVLGTDKQGDLPDVTKFLASFRKKGDTKAPSAMKDIPGGFVTKREPPE